ncbi:MAG: DMT family transporter [Eubacteriales bacterium]|nr:DMT family transporter [Eubacteriales bacterium]
MVELNEKQQRIAQMSGWILFLGVACWSLNAPLVKYISLDPLIIVAMRALIAGIVLLPFLRLSKLKFNKWTLMYLASYTGLCVTIVVALKMVAAPIAIGMQYTGMLWLFIIAVSVGSKKVSLYSLTPMILIFIGVIFFMMSGISEGVNKIGLILVIFEGVFFAGITALSCKVTGENPLGLTCIANFVTAIFVFACLPPQISDIPAIPALQWGILIFMGIFQIGAGYALYNVGLKYIEPYKASLIAPWEMILGPLWVIIFLREYPSVLVVVGFAIMLTGMFLEPVLSKREDKNQGKCPTEILPEPQK